METLDALYRICLIGPECTGKTTIAARLAERYGVSWVPEYAREYAAAVARPLISEDADLIARGQLASEDRAIAEALRTGARLLILDTDLVSTYVYARHYYGSAPEWVDAIVHTRLANHYLLLSPDCPFTPDPVRDSAADRLAIHDAMALALDTLGARYTRVGGGWEERWEGVVGVVEGMRGRSTLYPNS
ncbi:MAG TPA: ATP-binding protein [Vicinamibacterales bacterium]